MRYFLLVLVIFQLSTGNLPGNELLKMPALSRHYHLYRTLHPTGSWLDFLRLHYANSAHGKTDPIHKQLPLHASQCNVNILMLLPKDAGLAPRQIEFFAAETLPLYDEVILPSDFRYKLLRPPRNTTDFSTEHLQSI